MKKIEVSEAALDTLQRMVEELQSERDVLLEQLHKLALAAENLGHCEGGLSGRDRLEKMASDSYDLIKKCRG